MLGTISTLGVYASVALETTDEKQSEIAKLIDDAGPVAGLFVLVLGIVLFFLWKSMSRQLKRIDPSLPTGPDQREQELDRQLTERAVERGADDGPTPS